MPTFERIEVRDASGNELKEYMVTNGMPISTFGKPPEETASIIENIANLPIRDDDLVLWSAPKSGNFLMVKVGNDRNGAIRKKLQTLRWDNKLN